MASFIRQSQLFIGIYFLYQCTLMIAFALDSQEATFMKQDLALSDSLYGTFVSIAGAGAILGGIVAASLSKKLSSLSYLAFGMIFTMLFYTAFYASTINLWALISFILLGFFMAFSNTGYETLYQQSVPTELMGRFGSIANIFQSILQIVFTLLLGLFAEWFTLQTTAIAFGVISILLAGVLFYILYSQKHQLKLEQEVL